MIDYIDNIEGYLLQFQYDLQVNTNTRSGPLYLVNEINQSIIKNLT